MTCVPQEHKATLRTNPGRQGFSVHSDATDKRKELLDAGDSGRWWQRISDSSIMMRS